MENLEPGQIAWEGKFLRLCKRGRWEYVERTNARQGVVIVAVTPDQKLVLVEQYRVPLDARVIELPAGLVGDVNGAESEELVEAAQRELREETGYAAEEFTFLMAGPDSPGLTNEVNTMFLAAGLRRVGSGGGDEHEDILVHTVPLAEARMWLEQCMKSGLGVDPKVFAALYFLQNHA